MKHLSLRTFLAAASAAAALSASAVISLDYYAPMHGLCGEKLKEAACRVIFESLQYESAVSSTYSNLSQTFQRTDFTTVDGDDTLYWWDRYSPELVPLTTSFTDAGYQREHALPKSWWKDTSLGTSETMNLMYTKAYADLHHLFPANGSANVYKSNWPMGEVASAYFDNTVSKVGSPREGLVYGVDTSSLNRVFEPADIYKGDFARAYMYVATCYEELAGHWNVEEYPWMVSRNTYPVFTDWALDMLGKWHHADNVSDEEAERNDLVEAVQHNRNPFVDFPNLYEYVWGDSVTIPLNLNTTVKSAYFRGIVGDNVSATVLYESTFLDGDNGGCTATNAANYGFEVWRNRESNGWEASGYYWSTNHDTDAVLRTPEIDIPANAVSVTLAFDHACNKGVKKPAEACTVSAVETDGTSTVLNADVIWPSGTTSKYVSCGKVDLTPWAGKRIRLAFGYTSTTDDCCRWQIKNLAVTAKTVSAVSDIHPDSQVDLSAPVEYVSLDGRLVDPATFRGFAIRRQGAAATKVILR